MRFVPIEYIKENTILEDTLYSVDGVLLANEGIKLTARLLNKIKENQIFTLYITDEHSNSKINRLIHPNLRNKAMLIIKEIFLAGIFHDIGMALIPPDIFQKKTEFTTEEKMMIINPQDFH